jgi:hypothetical protein
LVGYQPLELLARILAALVQMMQTLRPFLGCRAPPQFGVFLAQPLDLKFLRLFVAMARKSLHRIGAQFLRLAQEYVLMDLQIPRRLGPR